jgi:hypothetical protein
MQALPSPGPDLPPLAVEIDARRRWGQFRVTFVARQNQRSEKLDYSFLAIEFGKRL